MRHDTELSDAGRQYAEAYAAHYTRHDLPGALRLYMTVVASHPDAQEAGYSRTQVQNITNAVVPRAGTLGHPNGTGTCAPGERRRTGCRADSCLAAWHGTIGVASARAFDQAGDWCHARDWIGGNERLDWVGGCDRRHGESRECPSCEANWHWGGPCHDDRQRRRRQRPCGRRSRRPGGCSGGRIGGQSCDPEPGRRCDRGVSGVTDSFTEDEETAMRLHSCLREIDVGSRGERENDVCN